MQPSTKKTSNFDQIITELRIIENKELSLQ